MNNNILENQLFFAGIYKHGSNFELAVWKNEEDLKNFDVPKCLFHFSAGSMDEILLILLYARSLRERMLTWSVLIKKPK